MKDTVDEALEFKLMYEQYLKWKASQEGQQDAYELERSFEVFCQQRTPPLGLWCSKILRKQ